MPALNFKKQFASIVESGEKRQTIRALRKDGLDPVRGQPLYFFTGMRTKACRRLGSAMVKSVEDIHISDSMISVGSIPLNYAEERALALADGFANVDDFKDFFRKTHGLPFSGKLIKW